jgi:hypothetical protein
VNGKNLFINDSHLYFEKQFFGVDFSKKGTAPQKRRLIRMRISRRIAGETPMNLFFKACIRQHFLSHAQKNHFTRGSLNR